MTKDLERRLIELETRAAFQDQILQQLSDALTSQQTRLEQLGHW